MQVTWVACNACLAAAPDALEIERVARSLRCRLPWNFSLVLPSISHSLDYAYLPRTHIPLALTNRQSLLTRLTARAVDDRCTVLSLEFGFVKEVHESLAVRRDDPLVNQGLILAALLVVPVHVFHIPTLQGIQALSKQTAIRPVVAMKAHHGFIWRQL